MITYPPRSFSEKEEIDKSNDVEALFSSDRELWEAFKQGNNSAFILIYERFFDSLYCYGTRINRNEKLVKDAIHDVFFDLKRKSGSLGSTDSIKFYLFKSLKRRMFRELKKWENLKEELVQSERFEITFSHEETLIAQQIDHEKNKMINDAIKKLSPRKREAIYYVYFEGMSYQQVAELMDLQDSKSARDLTYKALKYLRESIGFLPLFFCVLPD